MCPLLTNEGVDGVSLLSILQHDNSFPNLTAQLYDGAVSLFRLPQCLLHLLAFGDVHVVTEGGSFTLMLNGGNCLQNPPDISDPGNRAVFIMPRTFTLQHADGVFPDHIPVLR